MKRSRDAIVALDRQHLWHPYTPMQDHLARGPALVIARAEGATLWDADGRAFLDGNASWWVAALGHRHPRLVAALREQLDRIDHCSLGVATHEGAAALASEIVSVAPAGLTRVLFSDDGSTAVETALKVASQFHRQNGAPERRCFVALDGAFHGDTAGACSLGGYGPFRDPFAPILFDAIHVGAPGDGALEDEPFERAVSELEQLLASRGDEIAAVVVEPIVQGAAGMRIYSPSLLARIRAATIRAGALLVVDEVFTGYGRTGPMWACAHAGVVPDLLCTAKGFSGGMLPMAATLATERLFEGFFGDRTRALLHGHSFTGNPLGAAVAREVLAIYRDEDVLGQVARKAKRFASLASSLRALPSVVRARSLGMIVAADLRGEPGAGYLASIGWRVFDEGLRRGAILRPLGDTVYLTPPLTISDVELDRLCEIFEEAVRAATSC